MPETDHRHLHNYSTTTSVISPYNIHIFAETFIKTNCDDRYDWQCDSVVRLRFVTRSLSNTE